MEVFVTHFVERQERKRKQLSPMPRVGDQVILKKNYTAGGPAHYIAAGTRGFVIKMRLPTATAIATGSVGCPVFFESLSRIFPMGIVIPFETIRDPERFEIVS